MTRVQIVMELLRRAPLLPFLGQTNSKRFMIVVRAGTGDNLFLSLRITVHTINTLKTAETVHATEFVCKAEMKE